MRFSFLTHLPRLLRANLASLLLLLAVMGLTLWLVARFLGEPVSLHWSFLEPVIGVATLAVAAGIWIGERKQDYVESLPKQLTVVFLYPPDPPTNARHRVAMVCERAYLAGESDIRAWSQQLGGQMVGNQQLSFSPFIAVEPGRLDWDAGQAVLHYSSVFELLHLPDGVGKSTVPPQITTALGARMTIHWKYNAQAGLDRLYDQALDWAPNLGRLVPRRD